MTACSPKFLLILVFVAGLSCSMFLAGKLPAQNPLSSQNQNWDFQKFGGVVYKTGDDYQLKLDVYVPEGDGPFPAILAIHGGSWRSGTKFNWSRHARKLARAGFVVVAINYRHAPKFKFPAQVFDCKDAVRWMRSNAEEYKIDPLQIGGLGYSAGGHLAAMLGTTDASDGFENESASSNVEISEISTRLQAVAAGGAPCEFSWIETDSRALAYWLGASQEQDPEIYRRASPMTYITPDDPPFYFFQGTDDWIVPESSSRKMNNQLTEQGLDSQFEAYEGFGHFGLFSHLDAMDPVIDFFNQKLQRRSTANSLQPSTDNQLRNK